MIDWNTILITMIGSSGLATIIVKLLDIRNNKKCKKDSTQEARDIVLMGLAASDLIKIMQEEISKGCTDLYTRNHIDKVHKAYKTLNGNGLIDSIYCVYIKLPIKSEE